MIRKLLVVDDDEGICRYVAAIFRADQLEVISAHDGPSGLQKATADRPDVVLLDLTLPGINGLEVLSRLQASGLSMPVVMITGSRDIQNVVRATQLGAFDYLPKPISPDELRVVVRRALETRALRLEVQELRRHLGQSADGGLAARMGASAKVNELVEQVGTVAASDFTVLLLGETGTGKELVAQAVHQGSDRRRAPFIALDCGAIPEQLLESELFGHERGAFTGAERRQPGRLRLADGGTCFLDEIGNLPMNMQAKLLRVLESRQVQPVGADHATPMDVRFVAATNVDLQERVAERLFRADLYFRRAQYTIVLPPLRERADDIPFLTQRFIAEASIELRRPVQTIAPEAMERLRRYSWPGNVRELRNVVRQAVLQTKGLVIRSDSIGAVLGSTESAVAGPGPKASQSLREIAGEAVRAAERQAICSALRDAAGNKSHAAKALSTDYKTLHLKMKRLGISSRDFRS